MLQVDPNKTAPSQARDPAARRALVCAAGGAGAALAARLSGAGYKTVVTDPAGAQAAAAESEPHVLIFVAPRGGAEELTRNARGLRADAADAALPLVVVTDGPDPRAVEAAREAGADDCFPAETPPAELLARLDALFWRAEAGRTLSAAQARESARERRAEIDGFLSLLDAARAEIEAGSAGALALLAALPGDGGGDDGGALHAAHDFLRLNLRRADAVAFYGPDQIVAHLAGAGARSPRADFTRLLDELAHAHPSREFAAGLASFPEDGRRLEALIERAESALEEARRARQSDATHAGSEPEEQPSGPPGQCTPRPADAPRPHTDDERPSSQTGELPDGRGQERLPGASGARRPAAGLAERRAVRESRGGDSFETSILPGAGAAGHADAGTALARTAYEAAARERERRSSGAAMPRRVLLTVSDPARMAQVNLLLRSAAYEVRAAFDGEQALALLRIERADLLLIDSALKGLDGLEVLRRLRERHRGRLPIPALVLLPPGGGAAREEARRLGATGFVELPYDPAELLESVRETGGKD